MKNLYLIIIVFFVVFLQAEAQDKYNIQINIDGYKDSSLLLTTYYGDKILLVDTAYARTPGTFVFDGNDPLPGGVYMAVSQKKIKLFEFIVNQQQEFTLNTDTSAYSINLTTEGSKENKLFFEYIRYNEQLFSNSRVFRDSMEDLERGTNEHKALERKIESINKQATEYKINIINNNTDLFISKLLSAMREVEIPDSISKSTDSTAAYRYFRNHYWDFFDLKDARLLHTPMFSKKVDQYFDQLVVVHPDSVIAAIDEVIALARPSQEVVSWLVWHFIAEYQNPDYMGFDVVFIHLADQYFQKEEIINATASVTQNIIDRANKMRPLTLGSPAPNLILIDTIGNYQSFTSLTNDFLLLFFWDYDCGVCKKEIASLKTLMTDTGFDIGVFAINVNADLEKWKLGIIENGFIWTNVNGTRSVTQDFHDLYDTHGTPAIFLLDKERKIIAKQLSIDQVDGFIKNYERLHKQ